MHVHYPNPVALSLLSPDFNNKLQAMGFELSDEGGASYAIDKPQPQRNGSSAGKKPSSIYRLVSKKCSEDEKPVVQQSSSSLKKVQFSDPRSSVESNVSQEPDMYDRRPESELEHMDDTEDDFDPTSEETQSESQESFDETFDSGSESSIPESYKSPSRRQDYKPSPTKRFQQHQMEDDDVSLSAFVSDSVRRQSLHPEMQQHDETATTISDNSCTVEMRHHGQNYATGGYSSSQGSSEGHYYNSNKGRDNFEGQGRHRSDSEGSEEGDRAAMDDLLDEAMDDITDVEMRNGEPKPQPVSRYSSVYYLLTVSGRIFALFLK